MAYGITNDQHYSDIADAIRSKRPDLPSGTTFTPSQMAPAILAIPQGGVDPESHKWVRPAYLPDLDSVYNDETNTLYMTVDATGRISDPHVSIALKGAYTVQVGSIVNGAFVADTTENLSSNATWSKTWTATTGLYPVVKFTTSGSLTDFQWKAWTSADAHTYAAQNQPVIEIVGDIYSMSNAPKTPYYTEREKILVHTVTSAEALRYRWEYAYNLQELDLSDWNTSGWNITNMQCTWHLCIMLNYLDVSGWDTSNWVVTNLSNTWEGCAALKELDLSDWNTSGWAITNMNATWSKCYALKHLDVSTWDTSGWRVGSFGYTWNYCCRLQELDISGWDTSNWVVTAFSDTWMECYNLKELDLSSWNTSGWVVPSLSNTWNRCANLQTLQVGDWDTSGWAVTTMNSTWYYCYNLKELDLSGWDASGWPNKNCQQTFYNCSNLRYIDFTGWSSTSWTLSDNNSFANMFRFCRNLESLDLSWLDITKVKAWRNSGAGFDQDYNLKDLTFGASNSGKMSTNTSFPSIRFDASPLLTREAILNIFDALASGVSGKTLQLGSTNLAKLTAAEKQIATDKGWTLT